MYIFVLRKEVYSERGTKHDCHSINRIQVVVFVSSVKQLLSENFLKNNSAIPQVWINTCIVLYSNTLNVNC